MPFKKNILYEKAKRKINKIFLDAIQNTALQFLVYRSYWNYRFHKKRGKKNTPASQLHFIAQKPNYSAGIGHQLANWNAGFYFSGHYHVSFAHFPFSNKKWEKMLGLGENEVSAELLLKDNSFKKVRLPRFNSDNVQELDLIHNLIKSYGNKKILFLLAQDQGYLRQFDTYKNLSDKFFAAQARKEDKFFYEADTFNIAIHIRRGDIVEMKKSGDANWEQRWLANNYYATVLSQVLANMPSDKKLQVYIFSQGTKEDYPEFSEFSNIQFCLDVNAYNSFIHMVYSNLLISSKSSFSYKPALISKGIKICPENFWHGYPATTDFILADNNGKFDQNKLLANLEKC